MRLFLRISLVGALAPVLLAPSTGRAATFCVGTVADLEAAFVTARTNNQDDIIRVRTGTYNLTSSLTFGNGLGDDGKSLTIQGGWVQVFSACSRLKPDPAYTVLKGQFGVSSILVKPDHGPSALGVVYRIEGLTFDKGGAYMADTATGSGYEFEFVDNVVTTSYVPESTSVSSVTLGSGQVVRITNNLFHGLDGLKTWALNIASSGPSNQAFVTHNTFADNVGALVAKAYCVPGNHVVFENNLFAHNEIDLQVHDDCDTTLAFNSYNTLVGTADSSSNNWSFVDPGFREPAADDYRLLYESPVRDLGDPTPISGLPSLDIKANPRVNGPAPDLGAYEVPWIFADGFESGALNAWSATVP